MTLDLGSNVLIALGLLCLTSLLWRLVGIWIARAENAAQDHTVHHVEHRDSDEERY